MELWVAILVLAAILGAFVWSVFSTKPQSDGDQQPPQSVG